MIGSNGSSDSNTLDSGHLDCQNSSRYNWPQINQICASFLNISTLKGAVVNVYVVFVTYVPVQVIPTI